MHQKTVEYYNVQAELLAVQYQKADVKSLQLLLHRWLPAGGRVLEIGCGSGRDSAFMASLGCAVVATDASVEMLKQAKKIVEASPLPASVKLIEASFPVAPDNLLLKEQFDAIVAAAVIMHIPDHELFEFAFQVRGMLKAKGVFVCSFCTAREVPESDLRLFKIRQPAEIQLLFERLGFRLLHTEDSADGLGRKIPWTTFVFALENSLGTRPVDQIESIINRDKKTATYKLALLRALCEIAQTSSQHVRFVPGDRVSIPLGLVVEKWLYYYWPLIDTNLNLPEMRTGKDARGIAFRPELRQLVDSCKVGGLDSFFSLFENGRLSDRQAVLLKKAATTIAGTIIKGPVRYSGGSLEGLPQVFAHEGALRLRKCTTPLELMGGFGHIYLPAGLWREMCLVGHWIGEAIIMRWAELSHDFAKHEVSIPDILARLIIRPELERDAVQAKAIYAGHADLACVWTGKPLTKTSVNIDHVIPFTLWHNNDLWNLLPSDAKINNQKRDKIVTRETLRASRDRVIHFWQLASQAAPLRFKSELGRTLLRDTSSNDNWEIPAFAALSEAVEMVALQRGVERWGAPTV